MLCKTPAFMLLTVDVVEGRSKGATNERARRRNESTIKASSGGETRARKRNDQTKQEEAKQGKEINVSKSAMQKACKPSWGAAKIN